MEAELKTLACILLGLCAAANSPSATSPNTLQAEISNGVIRVKFQLPNPERGYYRGSRFDWSGVIQSLEYKGHDFFGVWFPHYEPTLHDAITGPVEEFRSGDTPQGSALGYDEAKPGGAFVKIGVGVLRKPDDAPYQYSRGYQVVNPGTWVTRPSDDRIEFQQDLKDDIGYSYRYRKTVRLAGEKPVLILEHRLKNIGKRMIETNVYDHDFYVIDGLPTSPNVVVKFAFAPQATGDLKGLAAIRGRELVYLKTLGEGESAESFITGFSGSVKDNDVRVENTQAGMGVRQTGDHPLVKFNLWSIRTTVCPEAYIHLKIPPGKEAKWVIRYEFYSLTPPLTERK